MRVGQQGAGQAESAVHAAGQRAEALFAEADETDHFEDLVGSSRGNSRRGAQHAQMTADRTGRVARYVTEEYADFPRGVSDQMQRAASEVSDAAPLLELKHQFERRRLSRTGAPEERGDMPGTRFEGDVVDGGRMRLAGIAGQSEGLDHLQQDSATCPVFRV
ncbi:hypothetical protein EASAB2608_05314 [Streptomyces sp. EAS-AB2608]|nr:hypothetical protein EASAB2608_05314 [Streptomyces sp. EAS-AB2608]